MQQSYRAQPPPTCHTLMPAMIEVVAFKKTGGPLTKRIALAKDGSLCSDGSACVMGEGEARRKHFRACQILARISARLICRWRSRWVV